MQSCGCRAVGAELGCRAVRAELGGHLPSAHADVPRKIMKSGKEIYLLISRTVDKKI